MGFSQGVKDGVLEFLTADDEQLTFRLGVQFRDPLQSPPPPGSILPARYVRIQVASPPPGRVDGTGWEEGLQVGSGAPFQPRNPPADGKVLPVRGTAPLGQPEPGMIVLDRWVAVPAVPPSRALTRTFTVGSPDPVPGRAMTILSVPYPDPSIDGTPLEVAGVAYYWYGRLKLDRPVDRAADGEWVAVSIDRFFPPERASADYLVRVQKPEAAVARKGVQQPPDVAPAPVNPAW